MVFLAMYKMVVDYLLASSTDGFYIYVHWQQNQKDTKPNSCSLIFLPKFPSLTPRRMKVSMFSLYVFSLTLALGAQAFVLPLDEGSGSTDLISNTCKKTPFYDLCLSSLQSSPQSSNSDISGLAQIIADLVLSNATDTLDYIHGLLKQSPEEDLERALANCAELYIPVVKYTLPQSIDALKNGHYGFANFGISDAAKEAQACEKGFSGSTNSPLTDRNTLLRNLSNVAVAIINLI